MVGARVRDGAKVRVAAKVRDGVRVWVVARMAVRVRAGARAGGWSKG